MIAGSYTTHTAVLNSTTLNPGPLATSGLIRRCGMPLRWPDCHGGGRCAGSRDEQPRLRDAQMHVLSPHVKRHALSSRGWRAREAAIVAATAQFLRLATANRGRFGTFTQGIFNRVSCVTAKRACRPPVSRARNTCVHTNMKPLETTPGWRPHTSTNGHAPQGAFWRGDAFFVSPLCPLGCNGSRFARAGLPPCTRNKDVQGR